MKKPKTAKSDYEKYLKGAAWKKRRAETLTRDDGRCLACGRKALNVHHAMYPKELGTEPLTWLYSLCEAHHSAIHSLKDRGEPLAKATRMVVGFLWEEPQQEPIVPPRRKQRKRKARKQKPLPAQPGRRVGKQKNRCHCGLHAVKGQLCLRHWREEKNRPSVPLIV